MTEKEARNPKPSPETVAGRLKDSVISVETMQKEPVLRADTQKLEDPAKQLQGMISKVATLPKGQLKVMETLREKEK